MAEKWIERTGSKATGFRYSGPNGKRLREKKVLERIDALRIPPAWQNVHIAVNPRTPIQVWGFDARGRKQYRYHPRAVQKGELRKFYRVSQMGHDLPKLRSRCLKDLKKKDYSRDRVVAGIVLLIGESFIRVGSDKYEKENNTYGITTFRKSNVNVDGDDVEFRYVGKRSIAHRTVLTDRTLARFVDSLMGSPGPRLFRYQRDGEWLNINARDVNEYIELVLNFPYTAKDFRTWGGTLRAAISLSEIGGGKNENARKKEVTMTVRMVSKDLGNTPTILRKSYVHPAVLTNYLKNGSRIRISPRNSTKRKSPADHTPDEKALIAFLDEHAPERRKTRRDE